MSTMKGATQSRMLMQLTFAIILAAYIPSMVVAGGVFDTAKPIFKTPNDYKLIFKDPPPPPGAPAGPSPVVLRPPFNSPFAGNILQLAVITIEPCGVIGAHHHPRGTEHQYITKGQVEIGMFFEDRSSQLVSAKKGEGVVVPQGTIHYVRNTGCTKAEIFVAFDHPTAGAVFSGEALLSFPESFRRSAFKALKGPAPNVFFSKACKCH